MQVGPSKAPSAADNRAALTLAYLHGFKRMQCLSGPLQSHKGFPKDPNRL